MEQSEWERETFCICEVEEREKGVDFRTVLVERGRMWCLISAPFWWIFVKQAVQ